MSMHKDLDSLRRRRPERDRFLLFQGCFVSSWILRLIMVWKIICNTVQASSTSIAYQSCSAELMALHNQLWSAASPEAPGRGIWDRTRGSRKHPRKPSSPHDQSFPAKEIWATSSTPRQVNRGVPPIALTSTRAGRARQCATGMQSCSSPVSSTRPKGQKEQDRWQ